MFNKRGIRNAIRLIKYARIGATTSDLLQSLQANDSIKAVIRHADIITVTIEGNALIQATKAFLQTKMKKSFCKHLIEV